MTVLPSAVQEALQALRDAPLVLSAADGHGEEGGGGGGEEGESSEVQAPPTRPAAPFTATAASRSPEAVLPQRSFWGDPPSGTAQEYFQPAPRPLADQAHPLTPPLSTAGSLRRRTSSPLPLTPQPVQLDQQPAPAYEPIKIERTRLWLGRLQVGTTKRDVLRLFAREKIAVLDAEVRTRFEPAYAFVTVSSASDGDLAISRLHRTKALGVLLRVEHALPEGVRRAEHGFYPRPEERDRFPSISSTRDFFKPANPPARGLRDAGWDGRVEPSKAHSTGERREKPWWELLGGRRSASPRRGGQGVPVSFDVPNFFSPSHVYAVPSHNHYRDGPPAGAALPPLWSSTFPPSPSLVSPRSYPPHAPASLLQQPSAAYAPYRPAAYHPSAPVFPPPPSACPYPYAYSPPLPSAFFPPQPYPYPPIPPPYPPYPAPLHHHAACSPPHPSNGWDDLRWRDEDGGRGKGGGGRY